MVFKPKYHTPGVTVRIRVPEYYHDQIASVLERIDRMSPEKGRHVLNKFLTYLNSLDV